MATDEKTQLPRQVVWLNFVTLIVIIILAGYSCYSYQKLMSLEKQSAEDKSSVQALRSQAKQYFSNFDDLQKNYINEQNNLKNLKTQLEDAQTRLIELSGSSEWILSEANYLVFMARERLQAAKDLPTALVELEAADARLAGLGNPAFIWVREALAKDIAKLRAHPGENKQVLWEQVGFLAPALNELQIKTLENSARPVEPKPLTDEKMPAWRQALWQSWLELKNLIRVTQEDDVNIPAALTLQEKAQVLQILQLMIEQAQWAVLQGENKMYLLSLKELATWIDRYFTADQKQQALLSEIKKLEQQRLDVPYPEISQSIQALSQAMLQVSRKTQQNPATPRREGE